MGVFDMEGRLKKRGESLLEKKNVLKQIQIRTPHIVIPAQAGIQKFGIAAIFKYS